jgi:hypothetical protein
MAIGFPVKADYVTGEVLTATNMNDLSGTLNSIQSVEYAAGKNKIINGDFGVWQRGTSFSNPADSTFSADRWVNFHNGTGATRTISQQTFTPGAAPVAGYEGSFFLRYAVSVAGTGNTYNIFDQKIENVRTFAGQTVTLSFYAKADSARTVAINFYQNFGSGGSGDVSVTAQNASVTTAWQRFTLTYAIPSISGKTIGTNSYLALRFTQPGGVTMTLDYWGIQVEAGSYATDFQTATGTLQGELAACQRYFRLADTAAAVGQNSTNVQMSIQHTGMRTAPTVATSAALTITDVTTANFTQSSGSIAIQDNSVNGGRYTASNFTGITNNRFYIYLTSGGSVQLSAEL